MLTLENDLLSDEWEVREDNKIRFIIRPVGDLWGIFMPGSKHEEATTKTLKEAQSMALEMAG